jgi:rhodanese-related sulfurtransferase
MKQITYPELQIWIAKGKQFQLLDVREPDEHAAFNIGGVLIPLSKISRWTPDTQSVVVYCKRGIRSQIAIQRLASRFPDMDFYNLENGILGLIHNKEHFGD